MIYFIYIYNEYDSEQNVYFPPALKIGPVQTPKLQKILRQKLLPAHFTRSFERETKLFTDFMHQKSFIQF